MEFDLGNPLPISHDVLTSLFHFESDHMPSNTYAVTLKACDFDISVRRETISFVLDFSCNFDPFVSYLAVNYLDRFFSNQSIPAGKPWILRLLAVSCVSLALKMRETEESATYIQYDGGFIFDSQSIRRMELLILGALKWRMRSITPFSFISFFIPLFKFKDPPLLQALKARATEIIFKAQNEFKFLEFKPSLVAASALLSASHELFPLQFPCFRKAISTCSYVNKIKLSQCYNAMQDIAMEGYESLLDTVSSSSTPVAVLDRQCSSSNSDSDSEPTNSEVTVSPTTWLERDSKRRKISCFGSDNTHQLSQIQQF
ncbi:hypothetical protein RJ640_008126 [Escallonia rubra]|uniref:B-like cyclin n=1 Tax=Escallonia rubra TaxID=112253 RepID=A0AA88RNE9_9ASTE|nr:hypothetical protein RJ640_008126 [Escallonia rubra]